MAARPPCRPACSSASVSLGLPWAGVPSPLTPPLPDRHHTTASHILEESLGEFSLPAEPEAPPSRDKHVRGDPECPLHICGVTDDSPAQTPPDPAQVAQWQLQVMERVRVSSSPGLPADAVQPSSGHCRLPPAHLDKAGGPRRWHLSPPGSDPACPPHSASLNPPAWRCAHRGHTPGG
ncbi:uncharacterized protein LOC112579872 isoform X2 [Bubalus bubalis]|uniref:uncharacterized protein LOC112579872 isoform X2 n=1 Tax=Bubalus bubalis TaxID=89462 RepID=UPI001D12CAB1|nr:uncharacterized protein LOC112579872 isoform X2 [Bubalus bubalis]